MDGTFIDGVALAFDTAVDEVGPRGGYWSVDSGF